MTITTDQVREALRKDDFEYINVQIGRYIDTAKAALLVAIGYKVTLGEKQLDYDIPEENRAEFDRLSDSYIIEYVRAYLDQVDNERMLTIIATQCKALLQKRDTEGNG